MSGDLIFEWGETQGKPQLLLPKFLLMGALGNS